MFYDKFIEVYNFKKISFPSTFWLFVCRFFRYIWHNRYLNLCFLKKKKKEKQQTNKHKKCQINTKLIKTKKQTNKRVKYREQQNGTNNEASKLNL